MQQPFHRHIVFCNKMTILPSRRNRKWPLECLFRINHKMELKEQLDLSLRPQILNIFKVNSSPNFPANCENFHVNLIRLVYVLWIQHKWSFNFNWISPWMCYPPIFQLVIYIVRMRFPESMILPNYPPFKTFKHIWKDVNWAIKQVTLSLTFVVVFPIIRTQTRVTESSGSYWDNQNHFKA